MQAVNILGSIAYGNSYRLNSVYRQLYTNVLFFLKIGKNENVTVIVSSGAVVPLLDTLEIPPENAKQALMERRKLLEASTRALKAICSHSKVSRQEVFTVRKKKKKTTLYFVTLFLT
jgi:hypothetical protein